MPSIFAPAPIGGAISGFTEAFLRAQALRQQQERGAQLGHLAALQIAQAEDEARQRDLARSVVPQILAAQPEMVEMVPAQPPSVAMIGAPSEPGFETAPGRPAVVEHALTPGMLARQVGPEGVAAALTRPEGRAALAMKGVISNAELERRKRMRQAFETFRAGTEDAQRAWADGDLERGLLAEARAYRALTEVSDNPAEILVRANGVVKEYFKIRQDAQERDRGTKDLQRIAQAHAAFAQAPSFETHAKLIEAVMAPESDTGRRKALEIAGQMALGKMDEVQHVGLRRLSARAAAIFAAQDQQTGKGDYVAALRQAAREDLDAAGQAFAAMVATGKEVPELWQRAFFGQVAPKSAFDLAKATAEKDGHIPGSPAYLQAVAKHLADLGGRRDQDVAQLVQQQDSLARRERTLQHEIDQAEHGTREHAELTAELKDVRGHLRGIRVELERRGALPKAKEPKEPAVPEAKSPPARTLVAEDSREYRDRAVAEGQRLIRLGHTKQSAIAAMQRAGWRVE